jgi:hypothetical protein
METGIAVETGCAANLKNVNETEGGSNECSALSLRVHAGIRF